MGTVGLISQLFGKSDYREITKTLLRNYVVAILAALLIILSKDYILYLIKQFFVISLGYLMSCLLANQKSLINPPAPCQGHQGC